MKLEIKMKKSGLLIRAALPVFALLGAVTFGSDSHAYADGKRVFKWIDIRTDASAGYRNDQLKFENRKATNWFDVFNNLQNYFANAPQRFVSQQFVRSTQDIVQMRGKTTIAAHDGALTNSFLEVMAQMGFPVNERKSYQGHATTYFESNIFRPRFNFGRDNDDISGNARTFDAHAVVGYDLAKLKNAWKDFAFKPFAGYYWKRQKTSSHTLHGFHRPNVENDIFAGGVFTQNGVRTLDIYNSEGYPSKATVENSAKWHGWFGGFIAESTWGGHTLWVRPEYMGVHTARLWTQTRIHAVSTKEAVTTKRGKNSYGWNLASGYMYRIDPDWTLHLDGAWTTMVSKRPAHKEWHFVDRVNKATLRSYSFMGGVGFNY